MTKSMYGLQVCIAGCSLFLMTEMANAQCHFAEGGGTLIRTQHLLGGSLTVGRDVPLGTEIYRQSFQPVGSTVLRCDPGLYNIEKKHWFPFTPLPLARWSTSPFTGKVYETGVKGIGVAIWHGSAHSAIPFSTNVPNCNGCDIEVGRTLGFDLSFIKIGEVSAGMIQGASLPTIAQSFITSNSLEVQRVNFFGNVYIVSRTCSTPDVNVQMGTHLLEAFTGKNTFTAWQDFSIVLNDCPAFNGYYQGGGPVWTGNGIVTNLESRKNNVLRVRLDSTRPAIDPALGILSLNPGASGDNATAGGFGLQVANSHGDPVILGDLRASGISTRADEGASYIIPLKARYIQTGETVSAGPANATATFTINYH